ncbi:putative HAD superfamily hydrolase [Annulohypoxylon maeteangense]|uniref:putative HAD superfamily hydrolase n=1 Tax=Annulohypoxylon maeteangense TaxID=1927788 RepID=UPI002008ABC5|nr:putative HAD superfamily hydrolase [Annulohypoxylon maeteangense]KAI0886144.1 putative HAD superfamily hydrolase [Annulohypoxylon maeteangense]
MKAFRNGTHLSSATSGCILRPHRSPTPPIRLSSNHFTPRRGIAFSRRVLPSISSWTLDSRSYSVNHKTPQPPPFAFAFDIDGVLLHVAKPIPGATYALKHLQEHNIPFILLTNGGGKHETDRVKDLSNRLGVHLTTDNFVQSHTPFQELVHHGHNSQGLRDKNILVTGSDPTKCRDIAEKYGFKHVIIPADILMAQPTIWPFEPLMKEVYAATARPLASSNPKIDAIFVFNDPRDWALDIQIISDLLLSQQGVLGTYSTNNGNPDLPNRGWQRDGQPSLFFSNPDLFWSAAYPLPRFGQGAFQAALAGVWDEVTGGKAELERTVIGKPYARTYGFAERVLNAHRAKTLGVDAEKLEPLKRVYMVGDNPASDIRGANEYVSPLGTKWSSILVRTGVWNPDRGGSPAYWPDVIAKDVKEAVETVLTHEKW